ncbi:MAG: AAA family ATPase, partial [Promethearchaeota archaeon]
ITEDNEGGADLVTYEEIGGLNEEIMEIREIIELPSKIPSLNSRFEIKLPRGILLYGPPGCGKSLLLRAISNESEAFSISINGPEIMSKFYGESEKKLRELFKKAENNSPAIIFIDNIDVVAPKREEKTGDVEKRVVAQLISLIDGLHSRGEVIVIGITNKIESLEPALLSPGRFDRIIEINLPEENSREEIFRIHTRSMPLEKSVSIKELAKNTQNFSGADITGVCKEALIFALRRVLPQMELDSEEIDSKLLKQIEITPNDFDQGLKKISKNVKLRQKLMEYNKTKENNNKKI